MAATAVGAAGLAAAGVAAAGVATSGSGGGGQGSAIPTVALGFEPGSARAVECSKVSARKRNRSAGDVDVQHVHAAPIAHAMPAVAEHMHMRLSTHKHERPRRVADGVAHVAGCQLRVQAQQFVASEERPQIEWPHLLERHDVGCGPFENVRECVRTTIRLVFLGAVEVLRKDGEHPGGVSMRDRVRGERRRGIRHEACRQQRHARQDGADACLHAHTPRVDKISTHPGQDTRESGTTWRESVRERERERKTDGDLSV